MPTKEQEDKAFRFLRKHLLTTGYGGYETGACGFGKILEELERLYEIEAAEQLPEGKARLTYRKNNG